MELTSINIGEARPLANAKAYGRTGIYKLPRSGPVEVTPLGIPGDAIIDTRHHGGHDQAIYIYTTEDYAWWSRELGQSLPPGTFGENLTLRGLESAHCFAGDRFEFGEVVLEVTSPRMPCVTLAARMGDPQFVKRFNRAVRPGLYCRVIRPGFLQAPCPATYVRYGGETVTIPEMVAYFGKGQRDVDLLRRYLAAPTPLRGRAEIAAELAERLEGPEGRSEERS